MADDRSRRNRSNRAASGFTASSCEGAPQCVRAHRETGIVDAMSEIRDVQRLDRHAGPLQRCLGVAGPMDRHLTIGLAVDDQDRRFVALLGPGFRGRSARLRRPGSPLAPPDAEGQ